MSKPKPCDCDCAKQRTVIIGLFILWGVMCLMPWPDEMARFVPRLQAAGCTFLWCAFVLGATHRLAKF